MGKDLNPLVKFWDPLGMIKSDFAAGYGSCSTPTVGWLREAEIKHGRVAMAAFVGYCVQANHIFFPVHVAGDFSNLTPEQQWDAVPLGGKLQIIGLVAASKFDGSVPALDFIPHYDGNIWAPLQGASGDFGVWSAGKGAVFSFANGVTTVGDLGIPGITPQ